MRMMSAPCIGQAARADFVRFSRLGKSSRATANFSRFAAFITSACHQRGMWFASRQLDTVEGVKSSEAASFDVPPHPSMI